MRNTLQRSSLWIWAAFFAAIFLCVDAAEADRKKKKEERRAEQEAIEQLPDNYRRWFDEVSFLLSDEERALFLALEKDYQRDAFIERFWKVRDTYTRTVRNEFRDQFSQRIAYSRANFGRLDDARTKVLVLNGLPAQRFVLDRCRPEFLPMEVWYYAGNSDLKGGLEFLILFYRPGSQLFTLWEPIDGFDRLITFGRLDNGQSLEDVCGFEQGEILQAALANLTQLHGGETGASIFLSTISRRPDPPQQEWVATFSTYSTDLDEGTETFPARIEIDYPGLHQSRTVLQGTVLAAADDLTLSKIEGYGDAAVYSLMLNGEILVETEEGGMDLFENFRYRFDFPAGEELTDGAVPMVFQRYLRPGEYKLVVKAEDLGSGSFFRGEADLVVPHLERAPIPEPDDPETARLLAEANAAIMTGESTIKILEPRGEWQTGLVRFDTMATGKAVDQVTFFLDGQAVLTKKSAPYNVELHLGEVPQSRLLRVEAYDEEGRELANDEMLINGGEHRFAVRLVEPRPGKSYTTSLRARADVQVPSGDLVERVELYLNETLVATVYHPPYIQPIILPEDELTAYVRAVAYNTDGTSTEDVVFINAPDYLEEVEVDFVELYTAVLDKNQRPVEGLAQSDFTVLEDEVAQEIVRFEQVRNLPIHAAVMLDISASMKDSLEETRAAALRFFEEAVTPKDRAAIITFNDHPNLAAKFTNDLDELASGLVSLKAERGTALYDSLVFSLYYFNGIRGQRAILLLSDGKDESSRFEFDDSLDFAVRAGVSIYTIGLSLDKNDARRKLVRLADETGGRSFFVDSASELTPIYETIQRELRSRYLLAYQSSNVSGSKAFRKIVVDVEGSGREAKTLRGYYP